MAYFLEDFTRGVAGRSSTHALRQLQRLSYFFLKILFSHRSHVDPHKIYYITTEVPALIDTGYGGKSYASDVFARFVLGFVIARD